MNSQINQQSRTLKLLVVVLSFFFVTMIYSTLGMTKPACPGHPSCKDEPVDPDGPIQLGPGNDTWGENGEENLGDDQVFGGDGDDHIYGGFGNDDLRGEAGSDILEGEDGDDQLNGGDGADALWGGFGNDRFYVDGDGSGSCDFEGDSDFGSDCDFADGGDGRDSLYLRFLENVYVEFEDDPNDPESYGYYSGSYYDRKVGTIYVKGKFKNIEYISGSNSDGVYHGNELANEIKGHEGNDEIWGHGGDDRLIGGSITLSNNSGHVGDHLYGGEGNDRIMGLLGDDHISGGPGDDDILIRKNQGHDIVQDFESGDGTRRGDKIVIYNSDICWPDLTVTAMDSDNDGDTDATHVAWRVKNASMSITLLNFPANKLRADDFIFDEDNSSYSGCP